MKKYHKDVYMPEEMIKEASKLYCCDLKKSFHFYERASDKYKNEYNSALVDEIIEKIKSEKPTPIEIETEFGRVTKCVIREPCDGEKDICLVFRKGIIVTFWLNNKSDNHYTLDKDNYCTY